MLEFFQLARFLINGLLLLSLMDEVFVRAQGFLDHLSKISKFGLRYQAIPYQELERLLREIQTFEADIPEITNPTTEDELLLSDLSLTVR